MAGHNPYAPVNQPNVSVTPVAPKQAPPSPFAGGLPATNPNPSGYSNWVNTTGDSRVVFDGGNCASDEVIIYAKDFPAGTGMGRSRTRPDPMDASKASIDPALMTPAGRGSANDFVKVRLSELLLRPIGAPPLNPNKHYARPPARPMVSFGLGSVAKGAVIPNAHYPHNCGVCGGWYYQGTGEHDGTPDGRCPKSK